MPLTLGLEDALDLKGDADLVADDDTARNAGDRAVEVDTEVVPVDLAGCREAAAGAAVGVRTEAVDLKLERDRLGDAADGQVTLKQVLAALVLDAGRGEGHRRVVSHVEEVRAAAMRVELFLVGVDRRDVDRGVDGRRQGVFAGHEGTLELVETALDLANTEVPSGKADLGVDGVNRPRAGDVAGDLHAHRASRGMELATTQKCVTS